MKKLVVLALFVLPAIVLASAGHGEESRYFAQTGRESDYWPRVVNFTIFVALLYYLLANPIKEFFQGRKAGIAAQLKEIEDKLQVAKDEQKSAQARLDESSAKAGEILADAQNEATLLANKISEANVAELALMSKQLDEKMTLEERKSVREMIDTLLSEKISNDDIQITEAKVVDIISKKVA